MSINQVSPFDAQVGSTKRVAMFSAPGHPDTVWSDVKGSVEPSREIVWTGGTAAAHSINKVSGAAEIRTRSLGLQFSWNRGHVDADAQSGRKIRAYENRPRYGLILPPDTGVEFRIREKSNYRFLAIELQPDFVLRTSELQHLASVDIVESWDYNHALAWHLAQAIFEECISDARQGLLYAEAAITFLVLHVVRCRSNQGRPLQFLRRGGLPPAVLRTACDYMISRLADDVSLNEVASITGLSAGHFSFAFKQSMGIAPHAWLRRQRIDLAKGLLRDRTLSLTSIALTVGFASQSAFGIAFKKETGLTPTAWRRLHWL